MSIKNLHPRQDHSIFFVTFTCIKWKPLFQIANSYESVYKWFDYLYERKARVSGFVIMPNHIHAILYFERMWNSLNSIIGNAKRFLAYDIVQTLESTKNIVMLEDLTNCLSKREKKKGQRHKVFEESFDAKICYSRRFIEQKLNYIHLNPVAKKWKLAEDPWSYEHSSAAFYYKGIDKYDKILHVQDLVGVLP